MNLNEEERVNSQHLAENQSQEPNNLVAEDVYNIRLLEERLKVDRSKQKIGEVIIHKHIETRMVQVPVQREKLIIERVGEQPESLAEVVIGEGKVNGFKFSEITDTDTDTLHLTKSNFVSVETAEKILADIHYLSTTANTKVRIEIVTNSSQQQIEQQSICERYME